jgi:hypothetical protein
MTRLLSFDNAAHVLTELISFHEHLSEFYGNLASRSSNAFANMLLEFLASREKKLAETLERYEDSAPHKVLNTWIQVPYPEDLDAFLADLTGNAATDMDPLQVYQMGEKADDFVASLLTHVHDRCQVNEVRAVFADLLKGERDENIALSKAYNSLREM